MAGLRLVQGRDERVKTQIHVQTLSYSQDSFSRVVIWSRYLSVRSDTQVIRKPLLSKKSNYRI